MAEIVEMRMERSIPEYEMMRALKIIDDDEITEIVKKRENYDYLLARKEKTLKHFLEYINYERKLLKLLNDRKHRNVNIKLEELILQRIRNLHVQASTRFASDERIWNLYIKFMLKSTYGAAEVAAVFEQTLKFHDNKLDIWLKYLKWELEINKDDAKARNILLRSLRSHPNSIDLYLEFLDLELKNIESTKTRKLTTKQTDGKSNDDSIVGVQTSSDPLRSATVLYNNAKRKFAKIDVLIVILDKITGYSQTEPLQLEIMKDLKSVHCTDELFWNIVAKRELNGNVTFKPTDGDNITMPTDPKKRTLQQRIEICVQVYKAALSVINTDKMWSFYLDTMLSLNIDSGKEVTLTKKLLGCAFKDADDAEKLSEAHYVQYIRILNGTHADDVEILKVIKRAVQRYPQSGTLWLTQMRYHMQRNEAVGVLETFNEARNRLANNDESYQLWELYLGYLTVLPGSDRCIENVYDAALLQCHPMFNNLKLNYIEWSARHFGIKKARNAFKCAVKKSTACKELYKKMAELESFEIEPDIKAWRECMEASTVQFGVNCHVVWMDYIKFEMKYGDAKNFSKLFDRAINTLKPELVDIFISEREFLQSGMVA